MTATIQTIDTPDGAFTIIADDRGRVLASGWTADAEAARLRIHPRLRPDDGRRGGDGCRGRRPRLLRGRPLGDRRRRRRAGRHRAAAARAGRRCAASRPARRSAMPGSPRRSGSRARCGPRHPSARATRPRCSSRATACCARTGRSAASPGASTSSARCSRASGRLTREPRPAPRISALHTADSQVYSGGLSRVRAATRRSEEEAMYQAIIATKPVDFAPATTAAPCRGYCSPEHPSRIRHSRGSASVSSDRPARRPPVPFARPTSFPSRSRGIRHPLQGS